MKKCTWCGQEYPDNATACAVDGYGLVPVKTDPPDRLAGNKLTASADAADALDTAIPLAVNTLLRPERSLSIPHAVATAAQLIIRELVREQDNGLWLVWKCPRCLVVTEFNAIVSQGNDNLLGVEISAPVTMIDLRCTRCKYDLRVDPTERELLEQVRDATRQLLEGKISRAEYETRVLQTPAQFAKDLSALTRNWKCPGCGEENPINFETCWNCSSRHNAEISVIPEAAVPFPTVPLGGNPWEK